MLELLLRPPDDGPDNGCAFEDNARVPVVCVEDDFSVGGEAHVGHADLLNRVVLVALDRELHDPAEIIVPFMDDHFGDVEGARDDGLRRGNEIRLDGVDALHLLVAVLEEGLFCIKSFRVAPDDIFGKDLVMGLEVFDAGLFLGGARLDQGSLRRVRRRQFLVIVLEGHGFSSCASCQGKDERQQDQSEVDFV